jgi:hypothetical protein
VVHVGIQVVRVAADQMQRRRGITVALRVGERLLQASRRSPLLPGGRRQARSRGSRHKRLVLAFPWTFAVLQVTSLGSVALSVAFAFGVIGRQLVNDVDMEPVTGLQPARL